ncbi:MAG: outer membrane lipoprotein carrier protein LolA [Bacteroidales bacterium]|nr:outer membrane lipoprotein carrier protein LolA [Bacteroidales bacterium]
MKKTLFALCLLLCCGTAWTQQPKSAKPVITDESQAILKKMQQQLTALQSAKISFTLQSAKEGKNLGSIQGKLWVQGKAYKLSVPKQTIYCDGRTVWNYLPENREVSVSPYEESDEILSINPIQLISTYDKFYRSAFIKEVAEKGVVVQVIDLYPKQGQSFFKIRLVIRKDKLLPLRASVHEKDGTIDTYYFDQIVYNPSISGGFFTFDPAKHPGVDIIDLR